MEKKDNANSTLSDKEDLPVLYFRGQRARLPIRALKFSEYTLVIDKRNSFPRPFAGNLKIPIRLKIRFLYIRFFFQLIKITNELNVEKP